MTLVIPALCSRGRTRLSVSLEVMIRFPYERRGSTSKTFPRGKVVALSLFPKLTRLPAIHLIDGSQDDHFCSGEPHRSHPTLSRISTAPHIRRSFPVEKSMHGPAHRHAFVKPPSAARRPNVATWHGVELVDDYAWLKADNWQDVMREPAVLDPEIRAYLDAENAYCEAQLSETHPLQEELFREMRGRLKEDDSSVPAADGPFAYYTSFVAGGQYPLVCRCARSGSPKAIEHSNR